MKEVDITALLRDLKKGNKSSVERTTLIQDIIRKIQERTEELAKKEETVSSHGEDEDFDIDGYGTLNNFKKMGLYNMDDLGQLEEKGKRDLKDGDDKGEDFWQVQNALKVEKIKNRLA